MTCSLENIFECTFECTSTIYLTPHSKTFEGRVLVSLQSASDFFYPTLVEVCRVSLITKLSKQKHYLSYKSSQDFQLQSRQKFFLVCIYTYIYIYIHTYIYIYICIYIFVCVYVCVCACVRACVRACACVFGVGMGLIAAGAGASCWKVSLTGPNPHFFSDFSFYF